MSLRSGQVKRNTLTSIRAPSPSLEDSDVDAASATRKRQRRRNKAELDDYEYTQLSDPEERKLEKRRAKNRRTARVSRERKQQEWASMKAMLASQSKMIEDLKGQLRQRDEQIKQLMGLSSSSMGAPLQGGAVGLQKASESAALDSCVFSYSMLAKRTDLQPTAPPAMTCSFRSSGDPSKVSPLKLFRPAGLSCGNDSGLISSGLAPAQGSRGSTHEIDVD